MGQNILVTGASSGFGALTVRALADRGHTVYAGIRDLDGRNAPTGADAATYAAVHNVDLRTVELDVTDQTAVDAAVARIHDERGGLDVIVHNAGHAAAGPAEAFTPEEFAAFFDINVLSTQRVNRAVLPAMRAQGHGLLVWVGSSSTRGGTRPFVSPYFAAKAAEDSLAVSYAAELALFNIETTIIVPGYFPTGTQHIAHSGRPLDEALAAQYEQVYASTMARTQELRSASMPEHIDAADVSRAIADVVDTPHGRRPFRVHIDPLDDGAEVVNGVGDRIRSDFFHRFGLGCLLRPSARTGVEANATADAAAGAIG